MKKKKFTKPFLPVHMGPRLRFLTQKSVNNLLPLSHEGNTKVATLGPFRVKRPMQCVQQIIWAGNVLSEAYMCCLPACWPVCLPAGCVCPSESERHSSFVVQLPVVCHCESVRPLFPQPMYVCLRPSSVRLSTYVYVCSSISVDICLLLSGLFAEKFAKSKSARIWQKDPSKLQ